MEKIMFSEITALSNRDGFCSASNRYFADLYHVADETVSRWISNLHKRGHVRVLLIRDERQQIIDRRIFPSTPVDEKINTPPIDKNVNTLLTKTSTPIDKNVKVNTTSSNLSLIGASDEINPGPQPENAPQTPDARQTAIQWGDGAPQRIKKAMELIYADLRQSPDKWKELSDKAKNRLTKEQFAEELEAWVRRNSDNWPVISSPVHALEAGRSNFLSWLSDPICRRKYCSLPTTGSVPGQEQRRGAIKKEGPPEKYIPIPGMKYTQK